MTRRQNGIMILILTVIVALAAAIGLFAYEGRPRESFVATPKVSAALQSSDTGAAHTLEARFAVKLTASAANNVDKAALNARISQIVSQLDYDTLAAKGGSDYIKNEIRAGLSDLVSAEDLRGVYISDILCDLPLASDKKEGKLGEAFQGAFK